MLLMEVMLDLDAFNSFSFVHRYPWTILGAWTVCFAVTAALKNLQIKEGKDRGQGEL